MSCYHNSSWNSSCERPSNTVRACSDYCANRAGGGCPYAESVLVKAVSDVVVFVILCNKSSANAGHNGLHNSTRKSRKPRFWASHIGEGCHQWDCDTSIWKTTVASLSRRKDSSLGIFLILPSFDVFVAFFCCSTVHAPSFITIFLWRSYSVIITQLPNIYSSSLSLRR